MKQIFTLSKFCLLLLFATAQSIAQTKVSSTLDRKIVYAYEGFDYFETTNPAVSAGQLPSSVDLPATPTSVRQTLFPKAFSTATTVYLHNINTTGSTQYTNSPYALGWAGDWVASNATKYQLSKTPLENTINSPQTAPAPNTSNELFSLVNAGFYGRSMGAGAGTIGRRLQTSTGGPFYEYEIWTEANQDRVLDMSYTDSYWYRGGVGGGSDRISKVRNPESTIRTLLSTAQAVHKLSDPSSGSPAVGGRPRSFNEGGTNYNVIGSRYTGRTYTNNTSIGAQGSTIWLGFVMRLNASGGNEDAFVNLHLNNTPYQVDNAKLSIGYFGTTDPANFGTGSQKRWGLRVGSTSYVSGLPLGSAADSSVVKEGAFSLLVVSITFDYSTGNTVKFYVINDNSKFYDDITGDGIIDEPAVAIVNTTIGGDLSFHSLAYSGGNSAGRSDIDEIRFARTYDYAALSSSAISVIRDLCESGDGSVAGNQAYPEGNLGSVSTANTAYDGTSPGGVQVLISETTGGAYVGTVSNYNMPYNFADASAAVTEYGYSIPTPGTNNNSAEDMVMFMPNTNTIGSKTYGGVNPLALYDPNRLAPGFVYRPNQNSNPNDGSYYVGTQTRSPFGDGGTGQPIWLRVYDNSGDRLGNMLVVNAAYSRSLFFEQQVSGICPGTQYEFYADIINLFNNKPKTVVPKTVGGTVTNYSCGCYPTIEPGCGQFSAAGTDLANSDGIGGATRSDDWTAPGGGVAGTQECFAINPEVEFLIDDVPVYIPPISIDNDEKWHRIGFTFVTKAGGTVKIAVRNRAPGGSGNDLAMDNFSFRPCGPGLNLLDDKVCYDPTKNAIQYQPTGKTYRKPYYRWVIVPPVCQSNCSDPDPSKRVYCVSGCGADPDDDSDDPITAEYQSDDNEANWLIVGGAAKYDPGLAELSLDSIAAGTPGFYTAFPGGFIPKGTQIFAYSASESDANTQSGICRIQGAPASVLCQFTTLPVGLLNFKAMLESEVTRLDWKTVNEDKFREFIIERSADGRNFTALGAKQGKGVSKEPNAYVYYDYNPLEGTSYYRLKMINEDGTYQYSSIQSVTLVYKYIVYPVPADNKLTVTLMAENKAVRAVKIRITNMLGSTLSTESYSLPAGSNDIKLSTSNLQPGVYVLEINDGESITKKRIVINR